MRLSLFVQPNRRCTWPSFASFAIVFCSSLPTPIAFPQQDRSDQPLPSRSVSATSAEAKTQTCLPKWGHGFHTPTIGDIIGGVASVAVYDDGTGAALYVGGSFDKIWDTWSRTIARWDGKNWAAFPETFGPYAPQIDTVPEVKAMVVFDDGGGEALFVGGCFQTVGDLVVNTIAKWNGHDWSALGSGIDEGFACASWTQAPMVNALTVFDDGSGPALYAGGLFNFCGQVLTSNIAKWQSDSWLPLGDGVDGTVYALASYLEQGVTREALYVGGDFQTAGGVTASAVATWNGTNWSPVSTGIDGRVYAMAVYNDGTGPALYVAGDLATAGGIAVSHIAKWNGTSWSAVGSGLTGDRGVRSLVVYDDGNGPALYAGGYFTHAGELEANRIARWDGLSWSDVGGGIDPNITDYDNVRSMKVVDLGGGPQLVITGSFQSVGGVYAVGMAQWDGSTWAPMPGSTANGLDGWVFELTPGDDGTGFGLFAGGRFTRGGSVLLNRIGKWDGTSWTPLGTGMDGQVNGITFFDDGRGPALFAVGAYGTAGGVPANRVARWDGSTWEPLGGGLGEGNVTVLAVAGIDEGDAWGLYAGGQFRIADGLPADYVARWDGTAWSDVSGGVSSWVNTLTAFDDGTGMDLYAGGLFGVAKWDGVSWSAINDGCSGRVHKLVVIDDGNGRALYAGGQHGVCQWNGSQWISIGTTSSYGPVYGIDYFDDGTGPALFAAGYFYRMSGVSARNAAKWDGSAWRPLATSLDLAIYDLAVFDEGSGQGLFFGGDIRRTGNTVSSNIAKWHSSSLPGELDCDGDLDLDDYFGFAPCLTGPGRTASPACEPTDYDRDGDVDLDDYRNFSRLFTGTQ